MNTYFDPKPYFSKEVKQEVERRYSSRPHPKKPSNLGKYLKWIAIAAILLMPLDWMIQLGMFLLGY